MPSTVCLRYMSPRGTTTWQASERFRPRPSRSPSIATPRLPPRASRRNAPFFARIPSGARCFALDAKVRYPCPMNTTSAATTGELLVGVPRALLRREAGRCTGGRLAGRLRTAITPVPPPIAASLPVSAIPRLRSGVPVDRGPMTVALHVVLSIPATIGRRRAAAEPAGPGRDHVAPVLPSSRASPRSWAFARWRSSWS